MARRFHRLHLALTLLAFEGSPALAKPVPASAPLPLKDLATRALSYEPLRERRVLGRPLSVTTDKGLVAWPAGAVVVQTRELRTKHAVYAYVLSEDGQAYGFVAKTALDQASTQAPVTPTPRGILGALAALSPGRNKQDKLGAWTENAGVKNLVAPNTRAPRAVALTVDLCPNFNRFEAGLFDELATLGKARGRPIPVTAFLTAYWLKGSQPRRAAEVKKLLAHAAGPHLDVIAANHSYTHPYLKGAASFARNFLLKPGVDMKQETLGNELEILRAGFVPAPFFRFPGLVSSTALERAVRETFSLVVFGKGSWPGLGDRINLGDVVLVHGNGGEPAGVARLEDWLRANRAAIVAGKIDFVAPAAFVPDGADPVEPPALSR